MRPVTVTSTSCSVNMESMDRMLSSSLRDPSRPSTYLRSTFPSRALMRACCSGYRYLKAVSSSSLLNCQIPSLCASGAKMSSVSLEMDCCLCGGMCSSVRMLCSRSASLTMMIRKSSLIAMNICRRFSACSSIGCPPTLGPTAVALLPACRAPRASLGSLLTLVSPSTIRRTVEPNKTSTWRKVRSVSSTVSCSSPAITASASMRSPASSPATATGWMMKGSPDLRFWPSWAQ
mmetsp:Transcript_7523/g.17191  ORF Transcript_7523/g.17191 Transcript_7523/m.17191 type:complete len:233 (-) Transcript_7523:619-1317(-)